MPSVLRVPILFLQSRLLHLAISAMYTICVCSALERWCPQFFVPPCSSFSSAFFTFIVAVRGRSSTNLMVLGCLNLATLSLKFPDLLFGDRIPPGRHHKGHAALTPFLIRDADDGYIGNLWMPGQDLLDLGRIDILPSAAVHVLGAIHDLRSTLLSSM